MGHTGEMLFAGAGFGILKHIKHVGNAENYYLSTMELGKYVSENTRNGAWGTDAIKTISDRLKSELMGIRGFSESNIKNMRLFYIHQCAVRAWDKYTLREYIRSGLYHKHGIRPSAGCRHGGLPMLQ